MNPSAIGTKAEFPNPCSYFLRDGEWFPGRKSCAKLSVQMMGETNRGGPLPLRILNLEKQAEFEGLLLKHLDSLYNVALHLTRSKTDAEDLIQETSLRALKASEDQAGRANPRRICPPHDITFPENNVAS